MRTIALLAALLLAAAPQTGAAASAAVTAAKAWSRPAAVGGTAVGYMTLTNAGPADVLVGADSPVARAVQLHASMMTGGVMRMAADPGAPLPAHGGASFAPGGRHLMFVGLRRALKVGDRFPAVLRFRSGARVKVDFVVVVQPPHGGMSDMPGMRHDP